jgi:ribosomal protein L7/L12
MISEDRMVQLERKVDYLFQHLGIDPSAPFGTEFDIAGGDGLPSSFYNALNNGKKIEAIKIYRNVTGAGLAEAKAAVDAMERGERF